MRYSEIASKARGRMGKWCRACPTCDGVACGSAIPGPGAKGSGDVAIRNHAAWQEYRLNMDTIHDRFEATCGTTLFGNELSLPVLVGPVGDVNRHYGPDYDTISYDRTVLEAAAEAGTLAFTGDGTRASIMEEAAKLIGDLRGRGIPTIKPWSVEVVERKLELVRTSSPVAIAMDVDGAGLPFLRGQQPPAGSKSVSELADIVAACEGIPFVAKGVMTPAGAEKAVDAGAAAIVVSNHGGRVLDGTPSTAEVLPDIADDVAGDVTILVDGGIRSGVDVFRALALGADACLIARPFVVATYAGGKQGVGDYLDLLADELRDAMGMCGAPTVDDVTEDMLRW